MLWTSLFVYYMPGTLSAHKGSVSEPARLDQTGTTPTIEQSNCRLIGKGTPFVFNIRGKGSFCASYF